MRALQLIIHREYTSRVRTKAFILTTILVPIFLVIISALPVYLSTFSDNDIETIYIVDNTGMYGNLFESSGKYQFEQIKTGSFDRKGESYALLQLDGDPSGMDVSATFFSEKQQPPRELTQYINNVLSDAIRNKKMQAFVASANIGEQTVDSIQQILKSKSDISLSTMRWTEDGQASDTVGYAASLVGIVFTIFTYFFIMMYGSMVMQSVVEEKSNRIVEVIISSVKPFDLMMGKIIGIALTGVTQLLIWLAVAIVGLAAAAMFGAQDSLTSGEMTQLMNNEQMSGLLNGIMGINWPQVFFCFILYLAGGYLIFASLYAMFGSAAGDSQEAQQMVFPVTMILLGTFYAGLYAANNPESMATFWLSIIPLTSPVVMMVRTPFEVPLWHIALSLVLLYATAILLVKLSGKIYRTGILMYGKKVSIKEMFRWFSYK